MTRRGQAALAIVLASAAMMGCEKFIGADFGSFEVVTCDHAAPIAEAPGTQPGGAEDDAGALFAITTVNFGDGTPLTFRNIGYDLDGVCTNLSQGPSCASYGWASPDPTDGMDGRDNAVGELLAAESARFGTAPISSQTMSLGIKTGSITPFGIVRIAHYNKRVVDAQVDVDWYVPEFVADGGAPVAQDGGEETWALWDQVFADASVLAPPAADGGYGPSGAALPASRFHDSNAYVNNYTLVAHLPNGTIMKLASVPLVLDDVTLTINIGFDPFLIQGGLVTGKGRLSDMFAKMPSLGTTFGVGTICKTDVEYSRVKTYFCAYADTLRSGVVDPSAPCDSLSFGMSFTGSSVTLTGASPEPALQTCPPATDPANDSCSIPAAP